MGTLCAAVLVLVLLLLHLLHARGWHEDEEVKQKRMMKKQEVQRRKRRNAIRSHDQQQEERRERKRKRGKKAGTLSKPTRMMVQRDLRMRSSSFSLPRTNRRKLMNKMRMTSMMKMTRKHHQHLLLHSQHCHGQRF